MKFFYAFVLLYGVFGDPDEGKRVMEGDSVTLHTRVTDVQKDDVIKWWFVPPDDSASLIACIGNLILIKDIADERFKERLQISNIQTADLTIKNMRIKHSGLYKAQIIRFRTGIKEKSFRIVVYDVPLSTHPNAVESKTVLKTEGESVTLKTVVQTQTSDLIVWRFGDEGSLLAKDDKEDDKSSIYDADKKFKGRLKLDQTGSLIISAVQISDSGEYKLKISRNTEQTLYKRFFVSVTEPGLSAVQATGIICGFLLVIAVVAVIMYRRIKYEQQKQKVTVMMVPEGHSVTLEIHVTKPQSDDVIEWIFRDEVIASFSKNNSDEERFIDRLKVDDQTGSLTIRNIRTEDAGLYKVNISSSSPVKSFLQFITGGGPSYRQFNVLVNDEERVKSVMLGGSVTLYTDVTEIQTDDVIQWRFGDEENCTAEITVGTKPSYDSTDERFRNRLELNPRTGHLTITEITTELCGVCRAKIISSRGTEYRTYRVVISVIAYKGESVTLYPESEIQKDSKIKWMSQEKNILVTGKNGDDRETKYTDDERFRDRLKMNHHTGDLTITYMRERDAGLYTFQQINSDRKISCRIFSVWVKDE
ncbi:uncharacterized protein LOC130429384 isoform X2 [Triplophysa dalaica]|uniref:uncharacterized protein LOC130429384 isoform X2 n=1 Tax=Triplophysa dalaica TaxID=1582913 RepID=UPI0024DFAF29|nr:uncharacterized protein LOC130429384 isoform X2 [Triplophysa dalaica]